METKKCNKCNELKLVDTFSTYKYKNNIKVKNVCKKCESEYKKEYDKKNKEKIAQQKKEWYENNKEEIKLSLKNDRVNNPEKYKEIYQEYYSKNKLIIFEKNKKYYEKNKDKIKQYKKDWAKENEQHLKEKRKQYWNDNKVKLNQKQYERKKKRLLTDPLFKFKSNIRSLIFNSFYRKGFVKKSKSFEILGCSFEEFCTHIESLWSHPNNLDENGNVWMNWNNRGLYNGTPNYGWDIDHIIPVSVGMTEEDVIKLNHYTNLQPMCSYYNRDVKINKVG